MITILFDIDGTLIRTGGAGMLAIESVMKRMFGLQRIGRVAVHGRTDNGILTDLFQLESLSFDEHRDEFSGHYWDELPNTLRQCKGQILPGVVNLLSGLSEQEHVALGLLTGNSRKAAEIKLRHFELDGFFEFGGFGDQHSCRNDVAQQAVEAAVSHLDDRFDPSNLWVVGDTVNDVNCARSIGSRVVAVETGGACAKSLAESEPDFQFPSLEDATQFFRAVLNSSQQPVE